jgi:hypothetical protein
MSIMMNNRGVERGFLRPSATARPVADEPQWPSAKLRVAPAIVADIGGSTGPMIPRLFSATA